MIASSVVDLFPIQLSRLAHRRAWLALVLTLGLLFPLAQLGALQHALKHAERHGHHEPANLPDPGACKICVAYGALGGGLLALAPLILTRTPNQHIQPLEPSGKIPSTPVTSRARSPPK